MTFRCEGIATGSHPLGMVSMRKTQGESPWVLGENYKVSFDAKLR